MADRMPGTIRSMARIAELAVQVHAMDVGRWIWRRTDFTAADLEEVAAVAARVNGILQAANGRQWAAVMADLLGVTWNLHFGFGGQEQVRECLIRNGIITTV